MDRRLAEDAGCSAPVTAGTRGRRPPRGSSWWPAVLIALIALIALAGCDQARAHPLSVDEAAAERRPLTMRIAAVERTIDASEPTELGVSHYLTVDVIDGPDEWRGRRVTLPYDQWMCGAFPPRRGETVTASPARWVRGDGASHGVPAKGFLRPTPDQEPIHTR